MSIRSRGPRLLATTGALALTALATACATTAPTTSGDSATKITVVAAENFWGSLATQLGGDHAAVTSIITNPDTDPHDYEPTTANGRAIAGAKFVIVNGIGYDPWATNLVAANGSASQTVLNVGQLVNVPTGGNPHRWYSPDDVEAVINQITADYQKLDPADSAYFADRRQTLENHGLAQYHSLIADIKTTYAGTPIGASESIVSPLAEGLGLNLITPSSFLDAISEGSDPTAADKATIDGQIRNKQIKIYVDNSQNSTPDVQSQVDEAKAAGIPVATVTETLSPAGDTFQQWQVTELQGIQKALATATGK